MTAEALRVDARRNVERVLEAAIHVLSQDPAASVEQVAAASGVHRSTVYRRFPTREALLHALFDQAAEEGQAMVEAASVRGPSEAAMRALCADVLAFGSRYAFLQSQEPHPGFGRDPLGLVKLFRSYQRAGILRDDLSASWLVAAFSALAVSLSSRASSRTDRTHESGHLLAETFLTGAQGAPVT